MKTIKLKLATKIAIFTFILSFLGITILAVISYYQSHNIFKTNLINNLRFETQKVSSNIEQKILEIKKDILFLANSEPILGILRTTENQYNFDEDENMNLSSWIKRLEKNFKLFMKQNPSYYQMRLIGVKNKGKEIVRIELKDNGKIIIVNSDKLQNKNKSSYFKNTIKLDEKKIYVSNINLNREHGSIVVPHIPTIRISTPIYNGKKIYAIIVININVADLFEFRKFDKNNNIQTYISNDDGYYIYAKDKSKTFGFEFNKRYVIQDAFNIEDIEVDKSYFDDKITSAISLKKILINSDKHLHILQTANSNFFKQESEEYKEILIFYILIISFFIAILSAFLLKYLTKDISQLTNLAKRITKGDSVNFSKLNIQSGDEIEELFVSFKYMLSSLSKSKNELQELANSLEIRIKEEIEKNKEQESHIAEQSKLVAMGEMIGNIAHQWRQPLSVISTCSTGLLMQHEYNSLNDDSLVSNCNRINDNAQYLSKTIDDFKNFIKGDRKKGTFILSDTISSFLHLIEGTLRSNDIEIILDIKESIEVNGYENELIQCLINITNNAKDILKEREVEHSLIFVTTSIVNDNAIIYIKDNAGGIPIDIISKIFEPYFTTKHQSQGTGLGLHMARNLIVEGMKGTLEATNKEYTYDNISYKGAEFKIKLPLS